VKTIVIEDGLSSSFEANGANVRYVLEKGSELAVAGEAIDAHSAKDGRQFVIQGHLSGSSAGIFVGNFQHGASDTVITVARSGVIDGTDQAIFALGNNTTVTNRGTLEADANGVVAVGDQVVVRNIGTIAAGHFGVETSSDGAMIVNFGTITADTGISLSQGAHQTATFQNEGTVTGTDLAVLGYIGSDRVINHGTLGGDVLLSSGRDFFDGRHGTVLGVVDGGSGNDTLKGGGKFDILVGADGNDLLTGMGGSDVFVFKIGSEVDVITDFKTGGSVHDNIRLQGFSGVDSFEDLQDFMAQKGDDVVLNFGAGDKLVLRDVDIDHLSASDFIFN
jgi:Ca2+-binding RTX toxin-like protein